VNDVCEGGEEGRGDSLRKNLLPQYDLPDLPQMNPPLEVRNAEFNRARRGRQKGTKFTKSEIGLFMRPSRNSSYFSETAIFRRAFLLMGDVEFPPARHCSRAGEAGGDEIENTKFASRRGKSAQSAVRLGFRIIERKRRFFFRPVSSVSWAVMALHRLIPKGGIWAISCS